MSINYFVLLGVDVNEINYDVFRKKYEDRLSELSPGDNVGAAKLKLALETLADGN